MKLQIDLKTVFISIVKFKTLHLSGKLKVGLKSPHKSQTPSTKVKVDLKPCMDLQFKIYWKNSAGIVQLCLSLWCYTSKDLK